MKKSLPVLVIEDNPEVQESISRAFTKIPRDTQLAFSTSYERTFSYFSNLKAYSFFSQLRPPQFVILDLFLSEGTGRDILRDLKAHPIHCQVPVIVLSRSSKAEDVESCYAMGCNGYFEKPCDQEGYNRIIEIICDFWCLDASPASVKTGMRHSQ